MEISIESNPVQDSRFAGVNVASKFDEYFIFLFESIVGLSILNVHLQSVFQELLPT